ncbi:Ger(x)C family spore germination protein [Fodinisporobacter ferrooxydans]|uniref:Ger(X)C family spore germination protein n=1 Tax=Fodinisporobacter ferrooxydans TaxID=2901836 RepID=A0ABY4CEI6_9BACL|nr:Ger(x)C family spore germination protein [Alicyclobacillaceae bacterium MYW30-H2]
MKRNWMLFLICFILSFTLAGCWNRRELNQIGIVSAMGIDKLGNQYLVTIQFVNPGEVATQKGGANRAAITTYQDQGSTIEQAIRRMSTIAPRKSYYSHLQMLIIGEELAKNGVGKTLDFLSRDHELRTDFYIAVAKSQRAEDILNILTPVEKIPSQNLFSKLENSDKVWAATGTIKLDEMMSNLMSKGKEPVLTGIQVIGNQSIGGTQKNVQFANPPAKLKYTHMAVFRRDKLIGWLNEKESIGYNWTQSGHTHSTVFNVPAPKHALIGVEIVRTKTQTKGMIKHGKPQFDIDIQAEGNIGEVQSDVDMTKTKTIEDIQKKAEQDIVDKVERAIKKAKAYKADIFGFGEVIHRTDPKTWKQIKNHWEKQEFAKAAVTVHANVKIRRVGTVNNSFLKEME